jgi:hypothetical protein
VWQLWSDGGTPSLRFTGARSFTSSALTGKPPARRCPTHAVQQPQVGDLWTVIVGLDVAQTARPPAPSVRARLPIKKLRLPTGALMP